MSGDDSFEEQVRGIQSNSVDYFTFDGNWTILSDGQFRRIFDALKTSTSITSLSFSFCNMIGSVTDEFTDMLKHNTSAKTLELMDSDLSFAMPKVAEGLKVNTSITHFDARYCNVNDEGARAMSEVLLVNKTLRSLLLHSNDFTNEGCRHLAEALKKNDTLEELNLGGCGMVKFEGCVAIFEALKSHKKLSYLDLGRTDFNHDVAKALSEMLLVNTSLKDIWISYCGLRPADLKLICDALKVNRGIRKISVGKSDLGTEGGRSLAEALRVNKNLREIDVNFCTMDDVTFGQICESLKWNNTLRSFDIYGIVSNIVTRQVALAECLKVNVGIEFLSCEDNPMFLRDALMHNGSIVEGLGKHPELVALCQRNLKMHACAKESVGMLMTIRRWRQSFLSEAPKEIICMLGQHLWLTKTDIHAWNKTS